jgi:foldase protein PrsA
MKRKLVISSIIGASLFASFTIGAYAASKTTLFINGQKSNIAVKVIEGTSYVPLKDISTVFNASLTYNKSNNSFSLNSSDLNDSASNAPKQTSTSLKDAKSWIVNIKSDNFFKGFLAILNRC